MAIMFSSAGAYGQETTTKAADEKKKQEELLQQAELQKKAEYQKQQALNEELKQKQADIEAKRKEIQEKMKAMEAVTRCASIADSRCSRSIAATASSITITVSPPTNGCQCKSGNCMGQALPSNRITPTRTPTGTNRRRNIRAEREAKSGR